jgi:hypothetical protein
VHVS